MKSLSAIDGVFLHVETPETPMHVASLHLFDPVPARRFVTLLKRHLARRMHLVPIFQRKLASMPLDLANPVWVHDENVDLDYHVQQMTLPAPGTHAQLEALAARLHMELLDRTRPLWRLVVIDGLASGELALYAQFHHAVLDGQSGVLLANALYDPTPRARTVRRPPAEPGEHPGSAELAIEALRHDAGQMFDLVRHSPEMLRALAGLVTRRDEGSSAPNLRFAPRTALNAPITRERGFAAASIPLDTLKGIAAAHDAKLNDVVLALCSGVLRRWLDTHGGLPHASLIAAVPVSIRKPGNAEFTTEATMVEMSLATDVADPVERLRAIRDASSGVKALARRTRDLQRTDFPTLGVPWMLKAGAWLYGRLQLADTVPPIANVVVSNVAGPQTPLYMAGIRMRTYWPVSIVEHGQALNLTVQSYAGAMHFGFIVAHNVIADASELTAALTEALDELVQTTHPRRPAPARAQRRAARAA